MNGSQNIGMSGTNALNDHSHFRQVYSVASIYPHYSHSKHTNNHLYPNIVAKRILKYITLHHQRFEKKYVSTNPHPACSLNANLTYILHQENTQTHHCTAIAYNRKPVKRDICSHFDNKYM